MWIGAGVAGRRAYLAAGAGGGGTGAGSSLTASRSVFFFLPRSNSSTDHCGARTLLLWAIFGINLFVTYSLISWLPTLLSSSGWAKAV